MHAECNTSKLFIIEEKMKCKLTGSSQTKLSHDGASNCSLGPELSSPGLSSFQ